MKNILIVDDDRWVRTSLSEVLENAGYHAENADSGREAIKKISDKDFDVVLLDLVMPDVDGIEVLTELKRYRPGIKVIIITGFATIDSAVGAIKKGASDYIAKPYKIDELLTTIKRVIEETRFEQDTKKINLEYALFSLSNPIRRNIVKLLSTGLNKHLMEIVKELGIEDHTKVAFHLRALKASGIIKKSSGRSYSLTNSGEKVLNSLKVMENYFSE